jgi:hypothetical protein
MTTKNIENLTKAAQHGKLARKTIRKSIDNVAAWACDNLVEGVWYGRLKVVEIQSNVSSARFLRIEEDSQYYFAEVGTGKYLHGDFNTHVKGIEDSELSEVAAIICEELETLQRTIEEKAANDIDIANNLATFA